MRCELVIKNTLELTCFTPQRVKDLKTLLKKLTHLICLKKLKQKYIEIKMPYIDIDYSNNITDRSTNVCTVQFRGN